jgi:hypothetical protein
MSDTKKFSKANKQPLHTLPCWPEVLQAVARGEAVISIATRIGRSKTRVFETVRITPEYRQSQREGKRPWHHRPIDSEAAPDTQVRLPALAPFKEVKVYTCSWEKPGGGTDFRFFQADNLKVACEAFVRFLASEGLHPEVMNSVVFFQKVICAP